jgi:hypothetical protein
VFAVRRPCQGLMIKVIKAQKSHDQPRQNFSKVLTLHSDLRQRSFKFPQLTYSRKYKVSKGARIMYTLALYFFLLSLPSLLSAEQLRGGAQAPAPTAAPIFVPLFLRQEFSTCPVGQSSCTDGGGGCCDVGAACTFSGIIPICAEDCGLGPTCTGFLSGLCCQLGYTCNYQSTLCISNGLGISVPTFTEISLAAPTTTVAPESFQSPAPSSAPPSTPQQTAIPTPTSTKSTKSTTPQSTGESLSLSLAAPSTSSQESTTSTSPTGAGTGSQSTSTAPATFTTSGQGKLGFSLRILLAGCGLGFLCRF